LLHVDLAIVGAGPAGAAAALQALTLDPGIAVALIDKAHFPRDKVCGDGVGPEGVAVLEQLDAAQVLDGYPGLDRIRITSPRGRQAIGRAPRAGHVVPRQVLDARLHALAVGRGARAVHHRVGSVSDDGTRVVIDDRITARTVIAADGANSRVRRALGIPAQSRARTGLAMRGYADGSAERLHIGFVRDRWPAYVWAFPTGTGVINVGYGPFDSRTVTGRQDLEASLHRLLPDHRPQPGTLRAHRLPLSTQRPVPSRGRVLLAGDAASLVNPLTGEGIYYALLSGALAGAAAVRSAPDPGRAYRAVLRQRLGRHLRHTSLAAAAFRSTLPVEVGVAAAARDGAAFGDLTEFALGTGLVTPAIVSALTRTSLRALTRTPVSAVRRRITVGPSRPPSRR
jgi:geranylgeranyl reductase family protein